ncbi:MAG TPA: hypothetical protein VHO47_05065 [Candidatus Babeliales bacterium]|nr:hypothetical protein [Candidatus Babeliales bacterium]
MRAALYVSLILSQAIFSMEIDHDDEAIWKKIEQLKNHPEKKNLVQTLVGLAQEEKVDPEHEKNLPKLEQLGLLENGQLSTHIKEYVNKSYQMNFTTLTLEFVKLDDHKKRFEVFIPETGLEVLLNEMTADEVIQKANPPK